MFRSITLLYLVSFCFASCGSEEKKPPPHQTAIPAEQKTMDSITSEIARARDLQQSGRYPEAMQIVEAMIKKYPGQLDALSIQAEILKEQGRREDALKLLEKAYSMQPRDKETAYNLAYEYADAKNPNAIPLTDTLIKYDKTETVARAWYIKATYYLNTGDEKEAMRFYDSANIADYNFLDAYLDKGQLQFKQKKYDAALKTFALGQKLSPGAAEFYFWVARTQEAMGNKADAKANYERAYALDKSLTEAKASAEKIAL